MKDTIDEIEGLLARATPAPWYHHEGDIMVGPLKHGYGPKIASANYDGLCRNEIFGFLPETVGRAALIVALRNAAPGLIAVVRAAEERAHDGHSDLCRLMTEHCGRVCSCGHGELIEALARLGVKP